MRDWICVAIALVVLPEHPALAQPKEIPRPPEFQKLIGPARFDAAKLRETIVFPVTQARFEFWKTTEPEEEIPPVAFIEKKLVGDDRDAEWLLKLGDALSKEKSDRADDAYKKSAAACRKRIEREPKVVKHYLDLCEPLYALHRPAEILVCAKKCVELEPKNADSWRSLADYYWYEFSHLVFKDADNIFYRTPTGQPPPELLKLLTDAEKEKARALLKEEVYCRQQWRHFAPKNPKNFITDFITQRGQEMFDDYFRTGAWNSEAPDALSFMSQKGFPDQLLAYARENDDPAAVAAAAMLHIKAWAGDKQPTQQEFKAALKKEWAVHLQVLKKMADQRDSAAALGANLALAILTSQVMEDQLTANRYAAKALSLAPREKAAIIIMTMTQERDAEFHRFWEDHGRKYSSPYVWLHLAFVHFRAKNLPDAERCLREGEKLDPKDRTIQLAKAALALKRGEATLGEAGRLLDAAESRLYEPAEKVAILGIHDFPSFSDSYRYLRAVHTALSGKWQQARDQLQDLREKERLAELRDSTKGAALKEAIDAAMEAFPRRVSVAPTPEK